MWHDFKQWFLYGDVYQFTSGPVLVFGIITYAHKHNCYEHRCPRIGRVLGDDGHHRCKSHHKKSHPDYAS